MSLSIKRCLLFVVGMSTLATVEVQAQDRLIRDYFRDYKGVSARAYSPNDPWQMGKILQWEVGHGRLFYNCDYEECKRQSPYINWHQQNTDCHSSTPVRWTIDQQLEEIKARIRWGSCRGCGTTGGGCNCGNGHLASVADAVEQIEDRVTLASANKVWQTTGESDVRVARENSARIKIATNPERVDSLLSRARAAARQSQQELQMQYRAASRAEASVPTSSGNRKAASTENSRTTIAKLLKQAREVSPATQPQREAGVAPNHAAPTRTASSQSNSVTSTTTRSNRRPLGNSRVLPRRGTATEVVEKAPTSTEPVIATEVPPKVATATRRTEVAKESSPATNQSFLSKLLAPPKKYSASGRGMGVARPVKSAGQTSSSQPENLPSEVRQADRNGSNDSTFRMLRR